MRLLVTGASGFLGQHIVPHLQARGFECVVTGRDGKKLATHFPNCEIVSYEEIEQLQNIAAAIHLAVLNNDRASDAEEFHAANVDFLLQVAIDCRTAGVPLFVNMTTSHAEDSKNLSLYAVSKRRGEKALSELHGITTVNMRLPAVHSSNFRGKLSLLNRFPGPLRQLSLMGLSLLRPVVHVDRVTDAVMATITTGQAPVTMISDGQHENYIYRTAKRLIDVTAAVSLLAFLSWVFIVIYVLLKFKGEGSPIFAQIRVGQHGENFICRKFRTMKVDTADVATHEVRGSSVTQVGKFLRRTKLDELPQLWNILKGEMSFVGPRPCLPGQTELVTRRHELSVYTVTPGLTGWAQIRDIDMSEPERLARADAEYVARRSLLLDIKILLKTFLGHGQGDRTST